MDRRIFKTMLQQMNPALMAQYSSLNHHVKGMDYLCLHRDNRITVKLYHMAKPTNPNSGWLVNPHSHRYSFSTVVLHGHLTHIRFKEGDGCNWTKYSYNPDSKTMEEIRLVDIGLQREYYGPGGSYWVSDDEIHTLQMIEGGAPVLLGLVQFADTKLSSNLYLPTCDAGEMNTCKPETPSVAMTEVLKETCLKLIN